jgi:ribosomal protein S18 acetylase RimI-like enzyme
VVNKDSSGDWPVVTIRPFRIEDYDGMIAVWEASGLSYRPGGRDRRENIAGEISRDTAIFLVAECGGKVIGTILGTHDGRKGWLNRLAVLPEFRHQGIARQLVERAEEEIYKQGIEIVACMIEDYNTTSMEFFQEAGYRKHIDIIYFSKRKHGGV